MNIRRNRDLKTKGDLQNAITSVILRQTGWFSKQDIYEKVEEAIKFSIYGKYGKGRKTINLEERIEETMNILSINDCIRYDSDRRKYQLSMSFPAVNYIKRHLPNQDKS